MDSFLLLLKDEGLPLPETEYKFHPKRKWKFDYCWVKEKVAVECEGGVWISGRHNRGSGFVKDIEKYNNAVLMGYKVLRYTPEQLLNEAIVDLKKVLKVK